MLTRLPSLTYPLVQPSALEVVIDGKEIIHRKCSLITLEEHGHKPPKESPTKNTLAFFRGDQFRGRGVSPFLK
jgi:hypothetical protein